MTLLSRANWPSVRAAIDIELDSVSLPDAIIELDLYSGSGEADVLSRDPLALTRTDPTEILHVTNAAILFTASYLVIALPRILRETFGTHYAVIRQELVRADLSALLRTRGNDEIDMVINIGADEPDRPVSFVVTCGGRDHSRWQNDPSLPGYVPPGW